MASNKLKMTRIVLVFLLISMLCAVSLYAGARAYRIDDDSLKVKNLKVIDIPDDDGSGVRIVWEPLPFEARVISYRVYRGLSPDSLFYIGELPVNPRIGVTTPTMSFYDRNFNVFTNIASPGRLQRERGQPADSPLFRALPRDVDVLGPMLQGYTLRGIIPKENFYFQSTLVERDDRVYAGIKPNQLTVAKKLIPGHAYYYTVVAVNESRLFFPFPDAVKGIPIDNTPETPRTLHGVFVTEEEINGEDAVATTQSGNLQFEWEIPIYLDDIRFFAILAVENEESYQTWLSEYNTYNDSFDVWVENLVEAGNADILSASTGNTDILSASTGNADILSASMMSIPDRQNEFHAGFRELYNRMPATMIWRFTLGATPPTYAKIEVNEGHISDSALWGNNTFNYTFNNSISEYSFVLSYINFSDLRSFSNPYHIRNVHSSDLPFLDVISIHDQKNDKGDYLELLWGKPFARIASVTYLNEDRTHIQMSYEYSTNENHKIRNIYFEVSDTNGHILATINEFFQDGIFKIRGISTDTSDLEVKMWFRTKQGIDREHFLTQRLIFDETILTLRPQELMFQDVNIDEFSLQIFKRGRSANSFLMSKKVPLFDRMTNDLINYEVSIGRPILDYCNERKMFLVDQNIDLIWDNETRTLITVPMFASEVPNALNAIRASIAEYQELYDNAETDADRDYAQSGIDFYTRRLESQESLMASNETLQYVNNITNQRTRARAIKKIREIDRRYFTYQMFLSDGSGMFTMRDITVDENGEPVFMTPVSNWFHTERVPMLIASLIFGIMVSIFVSLARRGRDLYIRPIAGIEEIDNAIGRATEMGRPILFVPGISGISDVATLAGLAILGRVAKKAAEYDTKILVPNRDVIVLPIAQEIVREAHYEAGRPDSFDKNNVFFVSSEQFAYVAGVNGVMVREKTATNFYMGMFYAESLIMTETGNATGAIQIAGTDAVTQIPFFITTCDYTLMGEELYAASAYMARQPLQLGTLKAQDYYKFLILIFLIFGTIFSSLQVTAIIDMFPSR